MSGTLCAVKQQVIAFLEGYAPLAGVRFFAAFPALYKETPLRRTAVAVDIGGISMGKKAEQAFMGGQTAGELQGCAAEVTLQLSICCKGSDSGDACHDILSHICDRLFLEESPFGGMDFTCEALRYDSRLMGMVQTCTLRLALLLGRERLAGEIRSVEVVAADVW